MKSKILGISLLTLTGLYGMLVAFVLLVCLLLGIQLDIVLLISIVFLIVQFLLAPFFTDLIMKWFYKAKFDNPLPDYLNEFINQICLQNKMKRPKFGYIEDGAPNAFTYGRTKNDARIILSRGIFQLLNEEEVKAVVAHEMGHIIHYDMAFMTALQLIPLVLYYIYEVLANTKSDKDDEESKLYVVGKISYILYIISQYIILWLSRAREYYADNYSIETTKNPSSLAQALVKIGYGLVGSTSKEGKMSVSKSNALGIFDAKTSKSLLIAKGNNGTISKDTIKKAMRWEQWNLWAKWYELNSTHPLISKRLLNISSRCQEYNQIPFIEFDLKPEENYNANFIKEVSLLIFPWILAFSWLILFALEVPVVTNFIPLIIMLLLFIKLGLTNKNDGYKKVKISDLIAEIKVSGVTSVPCIIEGIVIGRGSPGYIFDEDFIIQDETGFVFINSQRVFAIADTFAGLYKTKKLFGKKVIIKGWYRRNPVPYVEVYEMQVENEKKKKFYNYPLTKVIYVILLVASIVYALSGLGI